MLTPATARLSFIKVIGFKSGTPVICRTTWGGGACRRVHVREPNAISMPVGQSSL